MAAPRLLESRPRHEQALLLVVAPAILGFLTGAALGLAAGAYLVLNLVAVAGGVLAGLEHRRVGTGALRGLLGGAVFGVSVLLTNSLFGAEPTATLPNPVGLLVVISAGVGALLGALGALLRRRWRPARPA